MGLALTAYAGLEKVTDPEMQDGQPLHWEKEVKFYIHPVFPDRAEGIDGDAVYSFTESFRFGTSYGAYNDWRKHLATFAGYESPNALWDGAVTAGPFYELINFADNEGTIGPVVAAKLARDFAEFQDKADADTQWDGWFLIQYNNWRKAFEMAARNGAVGFH